METLFIYALKDPRDGSVRYIGKAKHPRARNNGHRAAAKKNLTPTHLWISSLRDVGLLPEMEILDEIPAGRWAFFERAYIKAYRETGATLTNLTRGGNGAGTPSEETRQKTSAALKGRKFSPEHCANISAGKVGRPLDPEKCKKLGVIRRGKKQSAETVAKRVAKNLGQRRSPEVRARMSEAAKARCAREKENNVLSKV